jgi:hypothetical protein
MSQIPQQEEMNEINESSYINSCLSACQLKIL